MSPTIEKPKHVRQAPSFINDELVATLSQEKQGYWARRKQGQNGQEKPNTTKFVRASDVSIGFDNEGRMIAKNRVTRRKKPYTNSWYTKDINSNKKKRDRIKEDAEKQQRKLARTRKVSQEGNS